MYKQIESYNMSTVTMQMVSEDENGLKAAEEVKKELIYIEKNMSFYLQNSEVSKINSMAGIDTVKVSDSTFKVIKESIEYSKLTGGIFDITLGPLISEWGIFSDNEKVLDKSETNKLLSLVNYKNIILDEKNIKIGLKDKNQKIDLGGIAKGYASDRAIEIYKQYGLSSAMINIGGNVSVLGRKINGELWAVGIQDPNKNRGEIAGAILCENTSVVTSGNYVRFFENNNKKYGHIFDSKKGIPIENDLTSVTIICKSGVKADAISTAVFALGMNEGKKLVKANKDLKAILITRDNMIYVSSEIQKQFYLIQHDKFKCDIF